jgi:5-hydroxyisourate hydrolase
LIPVRLSRRGTTTRRLVALVTAGLLAGTASAAEISTHVLDLAKGVGGQGVPVLLLRRGADGGWAEAGHASTDANGRVRAFAPTADYAPGIYKLQFDLSAYPAGAGAAFFPEINLVFRVTDAKAHYHVPVVLSPYGYSTYRGN